MDAEPNAPSARSYAVTLTLDDYYAFQKAIAAPALRPTPAEKPLLVGLWLLLVVLFVALFQSRAVGGRDLIVFIVASLSFCALWQFFSRRLRKGLAPAADGVALAEQRFELGEACLRVVSRHHETSMRWSGVRELRETPTHQILMIDTAQGYILPKRFLGDDAAVWALRSLIGQRITMGREARRA